MFDKKTKREMEHYAIQLSEAEELLFGELSKPEVERDAVLIAECNRNIAFLYNCLVYDVENVPPKYRPNKKRIFAGVVACLIAVGGSLGILCTARPVAYRRGGHVANPLQYGRSICDFNIDTGVNHYEYTGAIKLLS